MSDSVKLANLPPTSRAAAIWPPRLNHEFEALSSSQPDRAEMPYVAGGQATHAQFLRQRDDRGVHQAEPEVGVLAIDVHRSVQDLRRGAA